MNNEFSVGEWLVQRDLNRITSGDKIIPVEPKVIEVLVFLAEHPGDVLSKETILKALWEGTFVTDEVLTYSISELRKALGDDARNPRFIQTVPRRGYRLIAPVVRLEPPITKDESVPAAVNSEPELATQAPHRTSRWPAVLGGLFLIALIGIAVFVLRHYLRVSSRSADESAVLAVLPFENLGGNQEQEYFSDGLTEEMITQLGSLQPERLKVIARTTVMQYKGARKSVDQIGRELRANYVLEGTVRREGGRARVTAQLIQVSDQTHLWAESYDRELSGILDVQNELAHAVARRINITLSEKDQIRIAGKRPVVPQAHEAYLRGRFFWNRRTPEDIRKAVEYFEEAIRNDPKYARAYAGVADAWMMLNEYADYPPSDAFPRARAAALKALELDPELGEAHASLAMCSFCQDWNWAEAEKGFRRAISLNPGYLTAHHWYANLLSAIGRTEEARSEILLAIQTDSLSPLPHTALGWRVYASARQYDLARKEILVALELDPHHEISRRRLGTLLLLTGKPEEGLQEIKKGIPATNPSPIAQADLGFAYGMAGKKEEARKVLEELLQLSSRQYVDAARIALIYVGLGDKNRALEWLEKALVRRDVGLIVLKADPRYDLLRDEPKYREILRSMGFPK